MAMNNDDDKTTPYPRDLGAPGTAADQYRTSTPAMTRPVAGMFGNYAEAKRQKLPKWAVPLLVAMLGVHVVVLGGMWIHGIWQLEGLDRPKVTEDIGLAPPPPAAAPPPPGGAKPVTTVITPKKKRVADLVQIKQEKRQETPQETNTGGGDTESPEYCDPSLGPCGTGPGMAGGVGDGPPPPPPPPPPPAPPQNVPPTMLEGSRIAGEKMIVPDDVTKTEIQRSGKDKIIGSFKICLSAAGAVSDVKMLKSTGFPAYDNKILGKMRNEWKYRPYAVNGRAVPVCTAVTFIYSQK